MQNIAHFSLGFSIILKAVSKIDSFSHHPVSISFILFAGVLMVVVGMVDFFTPEEKHDKVFVLLLRLFGLFFLLAAAVVFLLNLFHVPDLWMNVTGVVFAIVGVIMIFFSPRFRKGHGQVR